MNAIQFSPAVHDCSGENEKRKHVIESCGDLYVVDRSHDKERIEKRFKYRWVETKNHWVIEHSFWAMMAVSHSQPKTLLVAKVIAFISQIDSYKHQVFDLEDGRIRDLQSLPGYSEIFWPRPPWLNAEQCSC
ncbi:hypothetical protein FNV43_RR18656 [Rhamnella rubrinervis]|uniref:Uncharacterized protein n=1 Tax=Rhamnella rubrinervis TaxID=2594499 RepID=A0A8K0DZE3_9ROSA|nr:hypothetical protein FNV43_RR18656 [Rhamnella rubrinervis]